jgi:hypothetical protein
MAHGMECRENKFWCNFYLSVLVNLGAFLLVKQNDLNQFHQLNGLVKLTPDANAITTSAIQKKRKGNSFCFQLLQQSGPTFPFFHSLNSQLEIMF